MRLGDLVEVASHFGLNERLVRTCVFRLARDGWLISKRTGRRSVYSLTPQGMRRFQRAFRRVYSEQQRQWDGSWTLVCMPSSLAPKDLCEDLKRELEWEGFGNVAPNVFGHPSPGLVSLRDILDGLDIGKRVFVLSARSLDVFATLPLRKLVDQAWNLDDLAKGYRTFLKRFAVFAESNGGGATRLGGPEAFIVRTLLIHWFRRVTLHDPQIPAELLPEEWPGHHAYELCHRIYQSIYRDAEAFLNQTVNSSGGRLPDLSPWFFQRFGGLT